MTGRRIGACLALLAVFTAWAGAAGAESARHVVVADTVSRVDLRATFPAPNWSVAGTGDRSWTRVRMPGTTIPDRIGARALPRYTVLLAVPRGTTAQVSVRSTTDGPMPATLPPGVFAWDEDRERVFVRPLSDGDGEGRLADDPRAWIEPLGVVRHVRLARLVVVPVRYDRETGSWTVTSAADLRIDFVPGGAEGGATAETADAIDRRIAERIANPASFDAALETGASTAASIPEPEPSVMTPAMIRTRDAGLHALRRADLDAAGVDVTGIDPSTFVMTHRGQEVAIDVDDGGDGSFDAPDDVLRFYADAVGGEETRDNVHRLTGGIRAGLRVTQRDGTPDPADPQPTRYRDAILEETNFAYWGSLSETVPTPWYWEEIAISTVGVDVHSDFPIELANVSTDPSDTGVLRVVVQSRRQTPGPSPNHHVRIYFNGNLVDDRTWTGLDRVTLSGEIPQDWVVEGTNTVRVENVADLGLSVQSEFVDWIQLEYHDRYVAEGDYLEFSVESPGPKRTAVEGFTAPDVVVYDVSNLQAPIRVTGADVTADGATWTVEFSDDLTASPAGSDFVAIADGGERTPIAIEPDLDPTALRDAAPGGADLLIIVHEDFAGAVLPLETHREAQGLRTVVAEVGNVFDEFNGGIEEVGGVRNFVQWAFENYAPPAPTYVLLVGDATLDPADYRGDGDNFVPTQFFRAQGFGIAPTDTWIGAVSGVDPLPDVAVGRIGARTALEVQDYVANLIAYENGPPIAALNQGPLYVADDDDNDFEAILEDLIATYQPPAMQAERVYLDDYPQTGEGVDAATDDIRAGIDGGAIASVYMGHGGRTLWAGEGLWDLGDVASLAAVGHLTFNLALNCVNGYFINLDAEPHALGEEWIAHLDRGSIGAFAPSATGTLANYDPLADQVFRHLFQLKETRVGYASWQALLDAHLVDGVLERYVQQMVFFGDPAAWLALDSDRDGLLERDEIASGTNPDDVDSDDDGLTDDVETGWDVDDDGDGRVNAADHDADDDGLPDGLESGITAPSADTDTAVGHFVADVDPASTTAHRDADTDDGGAPDGAEDRNVNGAVDVGETDPGNPADDPVCAGVPPSELAGVIVDRDGDDVVLTWDAYTATDPCVLYRVYVASGPGRPDTFEAFEYVGTTPAETHRQRGAAVDGATYYYLVSGTNPTAGEGELGHYGL